MFPLNEYLIFLCAALLLVLTPGPNMIYLISRSICQGRTAGVISLIGIVLGFLVHLLATAAGLSAIFVTFPSAYTTLKVVGALYLFWLAWQSLRTGALSPFEPQDLSPATPKKMVFMGFATSALNPKIALFYVSLFPQFIREEYGSIFSQSLLLGTTQIFVSFAVNFLIILSAAGIAPWFSKKPICRTAQKYIMGIVLAAIGFRILWS